MTQEQSPQETTDLPEEVPVPVESQSAVVEMWPPNDIFEDDETYLFSTFPTFEACHVRVLSYTQTFTHFPSDQPSPLRDRGRRRTRAKN